MMSPPTDRERAPAPSRPPSAPWLQPRVVVPLMLLGSSFVMTLAWLGHLRFKELSFGLTVFLAWLLVLPEYMLNIGALRMGYGTYTGGQMAAFRLCSGVVCVALVSRFLLDEPLTPRKLVGFGIMVLAMALISTGRDEGRR